MNEKSSAALSGRVDKIIVSPLPNVPDKAQITLAGSEPLYREMRIPDVLTDKDGHSMTLKAGQIVEVTIEADTKDTTC